MRDQKLANFPIMFFAVTMGLAGLGIAYEKLNILFGISNFIFEILRVLVSVVFIMTLIFYVMKLFKFPDEVSAEFNHPIKLNFFAALPISLFLLSVLWRDNNIIHQILYLPAVVFLTFLTLYIVSFWIKNNLAINHSNPAWFIPIVGNLIVIVASNQKSEILWYYYSVGMFFWIILFTIIFYRILFHDQLAQKFIPTLFIMIAPPAIAFLDYIKMCGSFDIFAHILINLTMFFLLLIFFMFKSFLKLQFFLSWWAFTFPMAAASLAFIKAYELSGQSYFIYIGIVSFIILVILVCIDVYFTIKSIFRSEICING